MNSTSKAYRKKIFGLERVQLVYLEVG